MNMPLTPTTGTVLNMTPATGRVHFTAPDGETWALPLVGYAVVVSYFDERVMEYETSIEPVVIAEGRTPVQIFDYMKDDLSDRHRVTVRVEPA